MAYNDRRNCGERTIKQSRNGKENGVLVNVFNFKSHTHLSQPSETVERSHSLAKAPGHSPCAENCISPGKLLISLGSSR